MTPDLLPSRLAGRIYVDAFGCWMWTGALNSKGYGCASVDGRVQLTHRIAYQVIVGPIADGLTVDHLCREKACCNPEHLEIVTRAENNRRANVLITHCPRGHEYTPENTHASQRHGYVTRSCRVCENAARRKTAA